MGKLIKGTQHRDPYTGSSLGFSNDDTWKNCEEFRVKRSGNNKEISVELFFPELKNPEVGVGLEMPSAEIAIAVGRALLTVAEGCADEVTVRF